MLEFLSSLLYDLNYGEWNNEICKSYDTRKHEMYQ